MNDHVLGVHHTAISVRDLEKSLDFYTKLGFVETDHFIETDGSMHIVQMNLSGVGLEVFWYAKNQDTTRLDLTYANGPDEVGVKHVCLRVSDADVALAWLRSAGLAPADVTINVARSLENSRYFFIQDPDGMWVEFIEDNRKARA